MHTSGHDDLPSLDSDGGVEPDEDPAEEFEATVEYADHPFASESFGTTAEEQEEGESLDQRLAEERPERRTEDLRLAIEDDGVPDGEAELVAEATVERDLFIPPEEAALTVRKRAPGAVDHPEAPGTSYDQDEEGP